MFNAIVDYEDEYVQPLILETLRTRLPQGSCTLLNTSSCFVPLEAPLLQFRAYESIDFETTLQNPSTHLSNAYIIRKALIRKHYLSNTISSWTTKHPNSVLKDHFKSGVDFELDYAEFLDDALVEAFELRESFERNEGKESAQREWWILKPGMSDRGQGIRLFSTEDELTAIFEEWEAANPDSEDDDDDDDEKDDLLTGEDNDDHADTQKSPSHTTDKRDSPSTRQARDDHIITSQLRHFIAQPYIHPPLLLQSEGRHKFHIRVYVLCVGALRVYVHKPMLALFAAAPYVAPGEATTTDEDGLRAHLTNTCLQGSDVREGSVKPFWDLPDDIGSNEASRSAEDGSRSGWKDEVWAQVCIVTGEVFEAAARGMMVHFQPLPNAFEVFGLDFLVDAQGDAWLLEVNAFPDFKQSGDDLRGLIQGLFEDVVDIAVKPFFSQVDDGRNGTKRTTKVLDIDLGRR